MKANRQVVTAVAVVKDPDLLKNSVETPQVQEERLARDPAAAALYIASS